MSEVHEVHSKIKELLLEYHKRIEHIRNKYWYLYGVAEKFDDDYEMMRRELRPHLDWLAERVKELKKRGEI